MKMTVSQLQSKHGLLVEALKRGESVELTYHGRVLGVVQPKLVDAAEEAVAMDAFFGMHKDMGVDSVEQELRSVRQGRKHIDDL